MVVCAEIEPLAVAGEERARLFVATSQTILGVKLAGATRVCSFAQRTRLTPGGEWLTGGQSQRMVAVSYLECFARPSLPLCPLSAAPSRIPGASAAARQETFVADDQCADSAVVLDWVWNRVHRECTNTTAGSGRGHDH